MSGGTGRVLEGAAAVLPAALGGLFMLGRRRLPALRLGGGVGRAALLALALLAGLSGLSSRALSGAPVLLPEGEMRWEEKADQIRIYSEEQSRNRRTGGSGLGLYLVKMILDRHGARCEIENITDGVRARVIFPTETAS